MVQKNHESLSIGKAFSSSSILTTSSVTCVKYRKTCRSEPIIALEFPLCWRSDKMPLAAHTFLRRRHRGSTPNSSILTPMFHATSDGRFLFLLFDRTLLVWICFTTFSSSYISRCHLWLHLWSNSNSRSDFSHLFSLAVNHLCCLSDEFK